MGKLEYVAVYSKDGAKVMVAKSVVSVWLERGFLKSEPKQKNRKES